MAVVRRTKLISSEDVTALLNAFAAETEVIDGVVHFLTFDFDELFEIVQDAFQLPPAFTRRQIRRMLRQALLDCRKAEGKMNEVSLLKRLEELVKGELAQKQVRFTMWTKFRAQQMSFAPGFSIVWNGVRIRSAAGLPAHLRLDEYFLSGHGRIDPRPPVFYGYVILSCDARDEESAVDRMTDALQLFMGVMNLYLRFGQYTHRTGQHWTDGPLWLGPYQFVFREKNFLGEDRIWYNPDYLEEAWNRSAINMAKLLARLPRARKALKQLATHPLRNELIRTILLLQDGMAARDGSHRLLRYWSALEQLYGESDIRSRNTQRIIQRASFAEVDPRLERWKLSHASRLRNEYVHAGGLDNDLDASTEHLRLLLCRHVNHLIFRRGDLRDHAELLEMADLPSDLRRLEERKATIDRRIAYIEGAQSAAEKAAVEVKEAAKGT
jgi:hypothetical protein